MGRRLGAARTRAGSQSGVSDDEGSAVSSRKEQRERLTREELREQCKRQEQRRHTVELLILEILSDHPPGYFTADVHRLIEERTTIMLNMRRLLNTLRRMHREKEIAAHWEGSRQRFYIPPGPTE